MRVLLDTCVLSELRKDYCNENVRKTIEQYADDSLFLSVITIGELTKGIELLAKGHRRHELKNWLQTIEHYYSDRILPIDLETVRIWGEITATAQKSGKTIASADGLIASTGLRHDLHIVTRNISDFEPSGALLVNPWE
jgi:predicted nucleic acid-binding protein